MLQGCGSLEDLEKINLLKDRIAMDICSESWQPLSKPHEFLDEIRISKTPVPYLLTGWECQPDTGYNVSEHEKSKLVLF